mmetsp:Transcript_19892/g.67388  ORF Transcript_19892/g.67388 Transcript_19892/m.67388 type:complete len:170 (-) Transcript_19892:125-634(-)
MRDASLRIIAAVAGNGVIGRGCRLPWHLPQDFSFFLRATAGGVLLIGRRTYDEQGAAFPGRGTVVLSGSSPPLPDAAVARTFPEALATARAMAGPRGVVWAAGGGGIFAAALPVAARLHLTLVRHSFAGDAFMPEAWREHFPRLCSRTPLSNGAFAYEVNTYLPRTHGA